MTRIDEKFSQLMGAGKKALIPYITAGDPDIELTKELVFEMERSGADIVELGVPFSDPLADGLTIQRATQRALNSGINLAKIFKAVEDIRGDSEMPLILMSYYNPILRYGIERFVEQACEVGVDGVIIPDLPPEESNELRTVSRRRELDLIFLLAPTSTVRRIRLVNEYSAGFIYCVSLTGVTGVRDKIYRGLGKFVELVRLHTDKPLAIGFGISNPEQAKIAAGLADGVIVGSAIVDIVERSGGRAAERVGEFVRRLRKAVDGREGD